MAKQAQPDLAIGDDRTPPGCIALPARQRARDGIVRHVDTIRQGNRGGTSRLATGGVRRQKHDSARHGEQC